MNEEADSQLLVVSDYSSKEDQKRCPACGEGLIVTLSGSLAAALCTAGTQGYHDGRELFPPFQLLSLFSLPGSFPYSGEFSGLIYLQSDCPIQEH